MIPYEEFEAKRKFVETRFGTIAYVEYGTGQPALFLHGLGINSYIWTGQLSGLSHHRRCIALDLMAHGHTEIPNDQGVTFTDQAEMVLEFLSALEIDAVDLVGNDSGGAIAQLVAAKASEKIRSLVLTNCDVHDNWPPQALEAIRATAPDGKLAANFAAILSHPELMRAEGGLAPMVFERPDNISDELTKIFLEPLTKTPERQAAFNRYVAPQDTAQLTEIEPQLRKLRAPALILWGTADIFFGKEWAYWLENTLPNAKPVIEFEGAKLFFPFERPLEVNAAISNFWNENS